MRRRPTGRQIAVLRAVITHGGVKGAAFALRMGERTVKAHLSDCYAALGVDNIAQAAYWLGTESAEPAQKD